MSQRSILVVDDDVKLVELLELYFQKDGFIYRITGLMFLSVAITVFLLIYLANLQMTDLSQEYVPFNK